ncbi:MAG: fibronectin type III-like domain-contianing protein, partial [bacterium]
FTLDKRAFAYWNTALHDWHVETGDFTIEVGASSRDLPVKATVRVESTVRVPVHYDADSVFMDIMKDPRAVELLKPIIAAMTETFRHDDDQTSAASEAISEDMNNAMMNYMPLRGVINFGGGNLPDGTLEALLEKLNG